MAKFIRWPQMAAVLNILNNTFEHNKYADKGIELEFKKNRKWGANDRRTIAEATYDMLRWWRRLHYYLGWDWQQPKSEKGYWTLALMWMKWRGYKQPQWDVVQEINPKFFAVDFIDENMSAADRYSMPDELYELGFQELAEKWSEYLEVLNEQAPVFLRTNLLKTTVKGLQKSLQKEEIETDIIPETETLKLKLRKNVFITESFKKGLFEVQDLGSQKIAHFVTPQPGERIVDACAGAGGKSLHLAALMKNKGKIISLDIHEWKLKELRKRARRNGVDIIECREINSQKVIKKLHQQADKVLLDVPCSGLGVIKRNPDTKWKMTKERLEELHKTQEQILNDYSLIVRPGGELVYATCSILPSENEQQVEKFLAEHTDEWNLLDQEILAPRSGLNDGFYMAKLQRKC